MNRLAGVLRLMLGAALCMASTWLPFGCGRRKSTPPPKRPARSSGITEIVVTVAPLHTAALDGDIDRVRHELRGGTNVDLRASDGRTALHFACQRNHISVVRALLAEGADPNAQSRDGKFPVHRAITGSREGEAADAPARVTRVLLDKGASVNANPVSYRTPLIAAITHQPRDDLFRYSVVDTLLRAGADPNMPYRGMTPLEHASTGEYQACVVDQLLKHGAIGDLDKYPLHRAAADGQQREVQSILDAGDLSVDQRDFLCDNTPLQWAVICNQMGVVKALIAKGADVNAQNRWGWTALLYAIRYGRDKAVECLLGARADPNLKAVAYKVTPRQMSWVDTPVFTAVQLGRHNVVKMLCERKAHVDWCQPADMSTPLCIAARRGDIPMVKLLLSNGAKVNGIGWSVGKPISAAAAFGDVDMVSFLVASGASVNPPGAQPPLCAAINAESLPGVRVLLSHGAQIDAVDPLFDFAPIHWAATSSSVGILKFIVERGADPNSQAGERGSGHYPLHLAAIGTRPRIVQALLDLGAKKNVRNNDGLTPADCAKKDGNTDILRILTRSDSRTKPSP